MFESIKEDWYNKNKHTLRYNYKKYNYNKNLLLESNRKINDYIPITKIDNYFDDNFICLNKQSRPLNDKNKWNNVIDELNELSIKTTKKYNKYDNLLTTTYEIPIIGHVLSNNNIKEQNTNWLKWNNQFYDPQYIYKYEGDDNHINGSLKIYCQNDWIPSSIHNMEIIASQKCKENMIKSQRYYQIDLKSYQYIKYIVTFGKYPYTIIFPRRKINNNHFYCDINKPHIKILNYDIDSYVKKYSISYKDKNTNKWIHYKEFDGNNKSYEEKINEIDIYTRYIRIVPIEYIEAKDMIIHIYSNNIIKNEKKEEDDDIEIVSYTLIPSNNDKVNDGYGYRCYSPDYHYQQYNKTERKKQIKNMLNDMLNDILNS